MSIDVALGLAFQSADLIFGNCWCLIVLVHWGLTTMASHLYITTSSTTGSFVHLDEGARTMAPSGCASVVSRY
jgi:hypothetical protein